MFDEIVLVAAKDLRIEWRSRVSLNQVAPFAVLILVLFGFALDADRATLSNFTPGLYWVAILLASILAVHRSVGVEAGEGAREGLLLSGLRPASVFLGKATALIAQWFVVAIALLFDQARFPRLAVGDVLGRRHTRRGEEQHDRQRLSEHPARLTDDRRISPRRSRRSNPS